MIRISFLILLFVLSVSNNLFCQNIEGQKGKATKQATVDIFTLPQQTSTEGATIKVPNPGWQPPEWSFANEKVIFRQEKSIARASLPGQRINSPLPDTTFAGLMDNGNSIPPDVNGAAGISHLMQTLNTDVRISDKSGNELFTTSLSNWWGPMPGNGNTFDPKIVYDPFQNRWIMITPSGGNSTNTRMYIGVSSTANPMDEWCFYWIPTDPQNTLWFDYPNLGFNKNWISIGGIMRNSSFEAVEFVVFAMDKMAAYNGEEEPEFSRFTTNLGSAIVPAFTYDSLSEEMYLISTGDGNNNGFGYVNLFKLSGTTANPVFELEGSIGIPEPWENWSYENHGDFLPQMGSSEKLNSVDARMHTMIQRNNKLWAVHHIYVPADNPQRCAIQWWNLDTSGVILERGRIEDPTNQVSYAFPSIAINLHEDVFIGHGVFSTNHYAGAAYSYKDNLDDSGSMRDYHLYKEGFAPYYKTFGGGRNRWGDYSAVCVDPVHDVNFWAMHEYAELPSGSDQWGTWWAYLMPSFSPAADFISDEILIPVGEAVDFTDLSLGVPSSWNWTFEGGTPGTSAEQNPADILFDTEGIFDVTLVASNVLGSDTIVKKNFITTSSSILPEIAFSADKTVVCTGKEVVFTDGTNYSPIQWEWQFVPATVTFINGTDQNSQNPEVIFNEAMQYSVSLTAWNLNGSSELTKFSMITAGGYVMLAENFQPDSDTRDEWTIENPDELITWELLETGGLGEDNLSMGIQFSEYLIGRRDRLISPPLNLSATVEDYLQFHHAYAKKYDPLTDSLIIYVSPDCGESWDRIFTAGEDGNGSFATHEQAEVFWPEMESDWCIDGWGASCYQIEFDFETPNTLIAFESYSAIGNPLFIDDVTVLFYESTEESALDQNTLKIFPNPSSGAFQICIQGPAYFENVQVFNIQGQCIFSRTIDQTKRTDNIEVIENWNPGIYLLKMSGKQINLVEKIIIEH